MPVNVGSGASGITVRRVRERMPSAPIKKSPLASEPSAKWATTPSRPQSLMSTRAFAVLHRDAVGFGGLAQGAG
jgi:hypothetical protein